MKYVIPLLISLLYGCSGHPLADWADMPASVSVPAAAGQAVERDTSTGESGPWRQHEVALRGPIELDDLLRIADARNPQIAEARAALGVATSRRLQAELYPNPSVEFETEETGPADGGGTRGIGTIALVQPIPIGKARRAAIQAATADQRAKLAELEARRLEELGDLRLRYVELVFVRRALGLNEELSDIAEQAVRIARTRFEAQASPESELIKAQIERARLELDHTALLEAQSVAMAKITSLLGGAGIAADQITSVSLEEINHGDLEELRSRILYEHPRLAAERHRVEAARRRVEEARGRAFDEVGVRVGYARDYANDDNLLSAGVSVPLPVFDRGQAKVLGARYGVIERLKHMQDTRDQLIEELTIAYEKRQSARLRLAQQRQRIVTPAERAWAQTQAGYQAGNFSFLDLLDAQRTFVDARSVELELLRGVRLAEARLWKLAGPSPVHETNEKKPIQDGDSP